MSSIRQKNLLFVLKALALISVSGIAAANDCDVDTAVAVFESIQGDVAINQVAAKAESLVCEADVIQVGSFSRAAVRLTASDTVVRLNQDTQLRIPVAPAQRHSVLNLIKGIIYLFSREPRAIDVNTVYANAAVEGTEFTVEVNARQTTVTVLEGRVRAYNSTGDISIDKNQAVVAESDSDLQLIEVVKPENAVQWALYYQPVLYALYDPVEFQEDLELEQIRAGSGIAAALDQLEEIAPDKRGEVYYVYRAALQLVAGQVDFAVSDIERALDLNPDSTDASSLQSIIALTNNEIELARQLAEAAAAKDPNSSAASLALSYSRQAYFDIKGALDHARAATDKDPDNALAWARVAELWLSQGNFNQALQSAEKAVELNPDLERTQTVLGFANLIASNFDTAIKQFDQGAELDQSAPLPRLGKGLVLIRRGELEAGRKELEVAVSLDPGHSLFRSYLGKAYFEERRFDLSKEQYALAKQFDPSDPTAYHYDAIQNQYNNRPVAALSQLRSAIKLNDRRAVYRSRLLLDQDRAVRGSSLAKIYEDLGFRKLALNEASKSLATDSSSHSAHRFLSDAYAQFDRQEIARSSALLQSQLLQPVSTEPVAPSQFGTNPDNALTEDTSRLSFNEYASLFENNRFYASGNFTLGSQDTLSDELVLSGIYNRFSYSLGQFHYESDGFRENNDIEHDIYNTFFQYELTNSMGIQAEYRHRYSNQGDIGYNFDVDAFRPNNRRDYQEKNIRLGLRSDVSSNMTVISSLVHIDREVDSYNELDPTFIIDENSASDGFDGQAQMLLSTNSMDYVLGAGWYSVENEQFLQQTVLDPETGAEMPLPGGAILQQTRQINTYLYTNFQPVSNLDLQLGASIDSYDDESSDVADVNAKLGINWKYTRNTEIRAAAFSTTKRALVAEQTLEPIQLAGFNQFYDDANGTKSAVFGLGIDNEISDETFTGAELFLRDLSIPVIEGGSEDQEELTVTAYYYKLLNTSWGITVEPMYEEVKSDRSPVRKVSTFSVPLAIRYFSFKGFSSEVEFNFVNHRAQEAGGQNENTDDFVVTSASLGYVPAGRYGQFRLEIRNVFDQSFNYQDLNPYKSEPRLDNRYPPARQILATLKLSF